MEWMASAHELFDIICVRESSQLVCGSFSLPIQPDRWAQLISCVVSLGLPAHFRFNIICLIACRISCCISLFLSKAMAICYPRHIFGVSEQLTCIFGAACVATLPRHRLALPSPKAVTSVTNWRAIGHYLLLFNTNKIIIDLGKKIMRSNKGSSH